MSFKVGLLGIGAMGAMHTNAARQVPGLDLVSCIGRTQEEAEKFAAIHGVARARTIEDFIRQPDVDAVVIAVSADAMGEVALEINALGLPLLLEKPVGLSVAETMAAKDALTVPVMVGLNRRFYEVVKVGRDIARQAGPVRAIEVHMPEDLDRLTDKHRPRARQQWQYANSVHLVDQFRFWAGEVEDVHTLNLERALGDRSYNGLLSFASGAIGHFNSQWYCPGGWRLAVYCEGLTLVYQPMERVTVLRKGQPPETIAPEGPDATLKPGLFAQFEAFAQLLRTGTMHPDAADMEEYAKSVVLVERLTRTTPSDVTT